MRPGGVLVGLVLLGCQGTSGGILPDARTHDAAIDPCANDPDGWATREVRSIASWDRTPGAIAADDQYVYWTEGLTCPDGTCLADAIVLRAPLVGGDREILFEGELQPGELAVTRDHLFVTIGDQLWRSQKDGTAQEVVGSQTGFVADADAIYYWQAGTLIRLAAGTLEETPIGMAQEGGTGFQLAGGAAWWLDPDPVEIWRMPLASGVAEIVTTISQTSGDSLAVDGLGRAYLATWPREDPSFPPTLVRIVGDGAEPEPIAELWDGIHVVAVDDAHVYWLEPSVSRLSRMPLDGGCVETRDQGTVTVAVVPAAQGIVVAAETISLVER